MSLESYGRNVTEKELHLQVAEYLTHRLSKQNVWHSSRNEGQHKPQYRVMQLRLGMRKGWVDIELIHKGRFIGIELKTDKGKLSKAQKECHDLITLSGGLVKVCRSLREVESFLEMAIGTAD